MPTTFQGARALDSSEAIKRAAREGLGVAFLSRYAVAEEIERGELAHFRLAGRPRIERRLFVVYLARRPLSATSGASSQRSAAVARRARTSPRRVSRPSGHAAAPPRGDVTGRETMAHELTGIGLPDVQAAYGGSEGGISELIMGEQVHIGGLVSSEELADRAGIQAGTVGVDLCCCTGAGMRFLVRFRNVARMTGIDATESMIEEGRQRTGQEGLAERIRFLHADACATGLPDGSVDFVWGEDAWCYVADKRSLIAEAARIVRPNGTIAFTDWLEGPVPMSHQEAERFLRFMTFPGLLNLGEYAQLLETNGCHVETAQDTGRFAPYVDLYRQMITMQLTYDALKIIDFDQERMDALENDRSFTQELAHDRKLIQGMLVARKL